MTKEEFNSTKWHVGMKVEILSGVFKGYMLRVVQPNFDQQLIGCMDAETDDDTLVFFRCENCKLV